ncbi:hypothetical protein C8J56DRAFT_1162588 [Mycena floridula]|nr:hypothetical protein C8J56DRAFT_1162588 [Mycena floridula]
MYVNEPSQHFTKAEALRSLAQPLHQEPNTPESMAIDRKDEPQDILIQHVPHREPHQWKNSLKLETSVKGELMDVKAESMDVKIKRELDPPAEVRVLTPQLIEWAQLAEEARLEDERRDSERAQRRKRRRAEAAEHPEPARDKVEEKPNGRLKHEDIKHEPEPPPPKICDRCIPYVTGQVKPRSSKRSGRLSTDCVLRADGKCQRCFVQRQACTFNDKAILPGQRATHLPGHHTRHRKIQRHPVPSPSPVASPGVDELPAAPKSSPTPDPVLPISNPPVSPRSDPLPASSSSAVAPTPFGAFPLAMWRSEQTGLADEAYSALTNGALRTQNDPPPLDILMLTDTPELLLAHANLSAVSNCLLDSAMCALQEFSQTRQRIEYYDSVLRTRASDEGDRIVLRHPTFSEAETAKFSDLLTTRDAIIRNQYPHNLPMPPPLPGPSS